MTLWLAQGFYIARADPTLHFMRLPITPKIKITSIGNFTILIYFIFLLFQK